MPTPDDIDTLMSNAVMSDNASMLEETITMISTRDPGELGRWLALASAEGNLKSMRVLLRFGASVNYQSDDGESPLSWACARNQLGSAKLLHESGADVNLLLSS